MGHLQRRKKETEKEDEKPVLLLTADLALFIKTLQETLDEHIDLLEIPAQRKDIINIQQQATLQEALELMNEKSIDILCVSTTPANNNPKKRILLDPHTAKC